MYADCFNLWLNSHSLSLSICHWIFHTCMMHYHDHLHLVKSVLMDKSELTAKRMLTVMIHKVDLRLNSHSLSLNISLNLSLTCAWCILQLCDHLTAVNSTNALFIWIWTRLHTQSCYDGTTVSIPPSVECHFQKNKSTLLNYSQLQSD